MRRLPEEKNQLTGRKWFLFSALLLIAIITVFMVFPAPKFTPCKKGETSPHCMSPADPKYISKRNIILIDVTDKLPLGKAKDVENLIRGVAFSELGLWEWLWNGKKIEKTSVYILSEDKAVDMLPIATYYSFPPSFAVLLSNLSGDQEQKIQQNAFDDIKQAITEIKSKEGAGQSLIVQSLATITSNADVWTPGSKLILVSDLYENSPTCGYFERGTIPSFGSVSSECTMWVKRLRQRLVSHSDEKSSKNTTVAVCQILSKRQQSGLVDFWEELFRPESQSDYDVKWTCDPEWL